MSCYGAVADLKLYNSKKVYYLFHGFSKALYYQLPDYFYWFLLY